MGGTGSVIGTMSGGPIGTAVGGLMGKAISDEIPATAIKSAIGKTARFVGNKIPSIKIPSGAINAVSRVNKASKSIPIKPIKP
jgi:uncharacterized protein YcfJ